MSFANLKKAKSVAKLREAIDNQDKGSARQSDPRFWKPTKDKAGNALAIFRFLPAPAGEDLPWVKLFSHGFKGPGGWYIENSRTTIGQPDPVGEYNQRLWNTEQPVLQEQVRKQKRRLSYIANIYVVKDPAAPANEGKVFLFRFGQKIFDKIKNQITPEFDGDEPKDPFDFWNGFNFRIKVKKQAGFDNYDDSVWEPQSALLGGDDAKLEAVYNKQYPLKPLVADDQFKPYAVLLARLSQVLRIPAEALADETNVVGAEVSNAGGGDKKEKSAGKSEEAPQTEPVAEAPARKLPARKAPAASKKEVAPAPVADSRSGKFNPEEDDTAETPTPAGGDDESELLDYFEGLTKGDE